MLQTNKPLNIAGVGNFPRPGTISAQELLASFKGYIRRQFPIIVVAVLLSIGLGIVYLLTTPPMFTAETSMIIDTRGGQFSTKQQQPEYSATDTTGMVESQVELIQSENVSLDVIKRFHLANDPEFSGKRVGLFGGLIDSVSNMFSHDVPKSDYERMRQAAEVFAKRLTVRRMGLSYIIQISFQSLDPQRAADIANAVADKYITDQLEGKFEAARRAGVWLQDRLRELREQALTAERAVVEFKAKNNIISTGGSDKRLVDEQQVGELNTQLVIARTHSSETKARLERIQAVLRDDSPETIVNATVSDSLKNDIINRLRNQFLDLSAREDDWSKRFGPNHLAVVNLRNQIGEIQNSIVNELRRIADSYRSDYEIAKQGETGIEQALAKAEGQSMITDQAQVELIELDSNAKSYRALYDDFLRRYVESVQQESFPFTEARTVTSAARPLTRSSPQVSLALLIAAAGGLIMGVGIGRLRDLSDRVFRTRSQVEELLALDCLAVLPNVGEIQADPSQRETNEIATNSAPGDQTEEQLSLDAIGGPPNPRTIAPQQDVLWHVVDFPLSPFAESIRSIKMTAGKSNKILGITSSLPNEGKSTISASLAQQIAHSGKKVILVDCDLRASKLTRRFAPGAKAGLLEVAYGDVSLNDVVWTDRSTNLSFLPTFETHRLLHAAEILGRDELKNLFEKLRKDYDYVIVDLPPLTPIVDVRATKGLVDFYVFVIEWGRTKIDLVERALKESGIYDNVLGVVLNKTPGAGLRRYEGYGSYDHDKYYKYYYGARPEMVTWSQRVKGFDVALENTSVVAGARAGHRNRGGNRVSILATRRGIDGAITCWFKFQCHALTSFIKILCEPISISVALLISA